MHSCSVTAKTPSIKVKLQLWCFHAIIHLFPVIASGTPCLLKVSHRIFLYSMISFVYFNTRQEYTGYLISFQQLKHQC
jgi:hypothetical protein